MLFLAVKILLSGVAVFIGLPLAVIAGLFFRSSLALSVQKKSWIAKSKNKLVKA